MLLSNCSVPDSMRDTLCAPTHSILRQQQGIHIMDVELRFLKFGAFNKAGYIQIQHVFLRQPDVF